MNSLNKVQLIGHITSAPDVRETPNGQKVANFSIATNRVWKDNAGMKQEQVEFHNIVAWTFLADLMERYTSKGKKIYVEGRLQTRSWDDTDGNRKYKTEIIAENILLLSSGEKKEGQAQTSNEDEINIEDIPF